MIKAVQITSVPNDNPLIMEGWYTTGLWSDVSAEWVSVFFNEDAVNNILTDGVVLIPVDLWGKFGLPTLINKELIIISHG